jgi:hypothetical protein
MTWQVLNIKNEKKIIKAVGVLMFLEDFILDSG